MNRLLLLALVAVGCTGRALPIATDPLAAARVPAELRDTGLYADWATRTVQPSVRAYTPGFTLWSDGANKSRWIYLPPGARIDVTDPNGWIFPVGTRLWKEFRLDVKRPDGSVAADQRVETRMLWKRAAGDWQMVTYVWSADQQSARLADATHAPPVPFPGTASYEVPVVRCKTCHDGRPDKVLGFEALLLAAPEADPDGLTWQKLLDEGLVQSAGALPDDASLQFLGQSSALERQAAGYLHANCGIACHHAGAKEMTPYFARLEVGPAGAPARIEDTDLFRTAINVPSAFVPAAGGGPWYRIRPLDDARSTLYYRIDVRNGLAGGGEQMPPIVTHQIDPAGRALIDAWIGSMSGAPYPPPAP
jgi:hypothetical protein